jgi:hypothetical protein
VLLTITYQGITYQVGDLVRLKESTPGKHNSPFVLILQIEDIPQKIFINDSAVNDRWAIVLNNSKTETFNAFWFDGKVEE